MESLFMAAGSMGLRLYGNRGKYIDDDDEMVGK